MAITIERARNDEQSFVEQYQLMLQLHPEGGLAPLNTKKLAHAVYNALAHGIVFVARNGKGEAVGTLAMAELTYWYSDETFLSDIWFYVLPKYRKGAVGRKLMQAVRKEADNLDKVAFIAVSNPDRRFKKTPMALVSQTAGYVPMGHTTRIR